MKKYIFLTLLMTLFFAANANPVDVNSAKEIGAKFLNASTNVKSADELQLVVTYNIDRGDAAFYVFNAENGFVIVAADDCATPILAYSDEGAFNADDVPPAMQEYLYGFVEQIQYGIENAIPADGKTANQWKLVKTIGRMSENRNTTAVEPLVKATWWQNTYYNRYCPEDPDSHDDGHALVGCVATAMGEIMHYHKWPATGNGTHSYKPANYPTQTANYGATTYDWNNMPNKLTSTPTEPTEAQINAVAILLWHCGVSVNMKYGIDGSSAYSRDVPNALLSYFKYSSELKYDERKNYDDAVWLAMVKACLDMGRPLYYSAASVNASGARSGHAFVCDGYDADDKLHFNWGWNGRSDGYFALNAMNPGSFNFRFENAAIFNIHPDIDGATQHTISVSSNDNDFGTAAITSNGEFNYGENATATATANSGYVFNFWSENGAVVSTESTFTFKVTYNRNLTAVFSEPNNITISASVLGDTGGAVSGGGSFSYGQSVTLTATPSDDYTFMYWLDNDNAIISSDADYTFKATESCSLTARFALETTVCEIKYILVDDYLENWRGNKLNVKYENTYTETLELVNVAMAGYIRKVIDGSNLKLSWTLGPYIDGCKFSIRHGEGDVFYEKTRITPGYTDDITVNRTGGCAYSFNGAESSSWSDASNWDSETKPNTTSIVGIKNNVVVDENVTVATLNLYDGATLTINPGVLLTVTGSIAQLDGAKVVIEEGGQLMSYFNYFIKGSIKTSVNAWNPDASDKGWYAISSPMYAIKFSYVVNLTNDTYNVYRYNETTMTWENCQNSVNQFDEFAVGRGYLYRRNSDATLDFDYYFYNTYAEYRLSNAASNSDLRGFNLIGNPYPHNIYKGNGTAIPNTYLKEGFYTLQTSGVWKPETDNSTVIKPCQAILVQALSTVVDNILYIENTMSNGAAKDYADRIRFSVTNSEYEDVAYAVFKEGEGLNKIEHRNEDAPMLYIRNKDEDCAIADIDDVTKTFGLHFKAATTGKYTLTFNAEGDFSYLHIIDKLTGDDVDMLVENEYSFIGSPVDDVERFVVSYEFSENSDISDNTVFAYQSGDDIVVCGEGTLQVFDITGRMVSTQRVNGVETLRKPSQGVCIFRLLGKDVKTQKLLIK